MRKLVHTRSAALGTFVVSTKASFLGSVIINKKGASSNVITVYNGTVAGGDIVAIIDTTLAIGALQYDILCPKGLAFTSTAGTAADVTVTSENPGV